MNIGFVSVWFERGAAYVTRMYHDSLKDNHNTFIYARGGERTSKGDLNWDWNNVTWGPRLYSTNLNKKHFKNWIKKNNLDIIFFNEQHEIETLIKIKNEFPNIIFGSYIDYYKQNTVHEFEIYDFLISNTKRHYSVFKERNQSYYIPWGTDIELFKPKPKDINEKNVSFFHSAGMSNRKGTTFVIEAFLKGELYKNASLTIHIQRDFEKHFNYSKKNLLFYNIKIIEGSVTAPGLYHLGDVYVYPTLLDGLGLTMYEALACGLPVITTDNAPMNEVINNRVGKLVQVEKFISRPDGYYWPLSIINEEALIKAMKYYIINANELSAYKKIARTEAIEKWDWANRKDGINDIFNEVKLIVKNPSKDMVSHKKLDEDLKVKIGSNYLYHYFNKIMKM